MRLTASMFWFDEPVDELFAQVAALEGVCDRLVAVDGSWEGFDPHVRSPFEQVMAIKEAAHVANLDLTLHQPSEHWSGEVAHRNYALALALTDADWIFNVDADERLTDGAKLREQLEAMDHEHEHVGEVNFFTVPGPEPTANEFETAGGWTHQRRLFRALHNMRYETHHWWLTAADPRNANWGRIALWGWMPQIEWMPATKLDVVVEHRTMIRTAERWANKRRFIAVRDPADAARGYEL